MRRNAHQPAAIAPMGRTRKYQLTMDDAEAREDQRDHGRRIERAIAGGPLFAAGVDGSLISSGGHGADINQRATSVR